MNCHGIPIFLEMVKNIGFIITYPDSKPWLTSYFFMRNTLYARPVSQITLWEVLINKYRKRYYMRVGMGYDVHKLVPDRPLILGGVEVTHTLGLLGHSDADVLVHAIMDALLGAAALGDIGKHFPDTDPAYKGISSMKLLEHVRDLIAEKGYVVDNIDATVIAQRPKLRPYIEQMEHNVADTLGISVEQVNIKATTEEWLGFTGREEGIASQAICSLSGLYESSMAVGGGCSGCGGCAGQQ